MVNRTWESDNLDEMEDIDYFNSQSKDEEDEDIDISNDIDPDEEDEKQAYLENYLTRKSHEDEKLLTMKPGDSYETFMQRLAEWEEDAIAYFEENYSKSGIKAQVQEKN